MSPALPQRPVNARNANAMAEDMAQKLSHKSGEVRVSETQRASSPPRRANPSVGACSRFGDVDCALMFRRGAFCSSIAWAVLARGHAYQPRITAHA